MHYMHYFTRRPLRGLAICRTYYRPNYCGLKSRTSNVFGSADISVNQLAVQGFLHSLCPVRDADFITWFNNVYPTGLCTDVYIIWDRYRLLTLAKSNERILLDNADASNLDFKKDEQELLAFLVRADKTHGTTRMNTLLVRCLNAKNISPRLHALLAPKGQRRPQESPTKTDSKPDAKSDSPLPPKACTTCKTMFKWSLPRVFQKDLDPQSSS
jgi:hypothetical protein